MLCQTIKSLWRTSEKGVTTVEYGIMLALVAIAVAGSVPGISDAVIGTFESVASTLVAAT